MAIGNESSAESTLQMGANKNLGGGSNDALPPVFQLPLSDSPGQMLLGDALTSSNYGEWGLDMKDALLTKNKFSFVDGTLLKPTDIVHRAAWVCCDAMVKGWPKTAMDKEIRTSVRFADTSRTIWVDLHSRFGQGNASRAYELLRLVSLLQQEKSYVSTFYTKLQSYWEESTAIMPSPSYTCGLCTCNVSLHISEQQDHNQLFDFLMRLDDAFSAMRTQVLAMRQTINLVEVFNIAINEEQQRLITQSRKPTSEVDVFAARDDGDRGQ
ncbi:unnamed protein product [Linum trigynum]|uniref:Retrotransposon Copia-like N-terminal domain-containing protein n=1 Tax=Linum trigynum TaxID=586398 RepID=A0AAV2ECY0_9ROSI